MCVRQSELSEFFAELTEFATELSKFSLPKQCSGKQYSAYFLVATKQGSRFVGVFWGVPCMEPMGPFMAGAPHLEFAGIRAFDSGVPIAGQRGCKRQLPRRPQ